jgi:predicted metal-dependent hydrolase
MLLFILLGFAVGALYAFGKGKGREESYIECQKVLEKEHQTALDIVELSSKWNKLTTQRQDQIMAELEADLASGRLGYKGKGAK